MKIQRYKAGQGLTEYALILAGVAVVVVLSLNLMGISVQGVYCRAANGLGAKACNDLNDCSFSFDAATDLDAWEGEQTDQLSIETGKACISGNGKDAASYLNSACTKKLGANDYSISMNEITVDRTVENNKNTGFDTWFRAQDDENGYLFIYNSKVNYVRFWKIVDGRWIKLAQKKVPSSWQDEELNFRVDVQGDQFKAYRDDELLIEASDSAYTDGAVGIRNKPSSKSCVGDIEVAPFWK